MNNTIQLQLQENLENPRKQAFYRPKSFSSVRQWATRRTPICLERENIAANHTMTRGKRNGIGWLSARSGANEAPIRRQDALTGWLPIAAQTATANAIPTTTVDFLGCWCASRIGWNGEPMATQCSWIRWRGVEVRVKPALSHTGRAGGHRRQGGMLGSMAFSRTPGATTATGIFGNPVANGGGFDLV